MHVAELRSLSPRNKYTKNAALVGYRVLNECRIKTSIKTLLNPKNPGPKLHKKSTRKLK